MVSKRTVLEMLVAITNEPRNVQQSLHRKFVEILDCMKSGTVTEDQIEIKSTGEVKVNAR